MNIAFFGLGAMGQRMVVRLLAAGHSVSIWNRSPKELPAGARWAPSPADGARHADIAISMVFDDAASRRVWLDPKEGAALTLASGALAVECSTLSPAWVMELRAALAVPLVDAPVVGSRPQAEAGQLQFLVGADPAHVARLEPVLQAMGSAVHVVGPTGSGSWLKLAVNSLFAVQVVAVAEQLALLRQAGTDLAPMLAALKALPVTSPSAAAAATLMLAQQHAPMAPVDLIAKDLDYAVGAVTQPLPLTAKARDRFEAARARGWGADHLTAVTRLYESPSGIDAPAS